LVGIFCHKNEETDSTSVLRFYQDKTVISISLSNYPSNDIYEWFKIEKKHRFWGIGNCQLAENKISFIATSSTGNIIYNGYFLNDDEIDFTIESQINGHKSQKIYHRLNTTPKSQSKKAEIIDIDNEFYPIVLIPDSIKNAIENRISNHEIYQYLNITLPKLSLEKIPFEPTNYKYIDVEKSKYEGDGCKAIATIPMVVFFGIMTFYCLSVQSYWLALMFLFFTIFMSTDLGKMKSVKTSKKVMLSDNEHKNLKNKHTESVKRIKNANKLKEENYFKEINSIEESIKDKKIEIEREIYYEKLKPIASISSERENYKRGLSELNFLEHLINQFGSQILVDTILDFPDIYYQPDFTFICEKTGVHIDIEVDEQYSLKDKKPIHYIGSKDDERNLEFISLNWCVVRFSENQVNQEPEKCIKLIKNLIEALRNKTEIREFELSKDKKWTLEEALVSAKNNSRIN
tara:strand:+ start:1917 stop:3296 length:1380 start_codon:yes stop_codon:yes gene_type:complete